MSVVNRLRDRAKASELAESVRSEVMAALDIVAVPVATGVDGMGAPQGVFLNKLQVSGFRGIGPEVSVDLPPGPGLTVFTGRNGCGKSSLAESMELLLTGDNARWGGRNSELRKGWRNLHHAGNGSIKLGLTAESKPHFQVECALTSDDLAGIRPTVSFPGKSPQPTDALGWNSALATYRPFLSYGELGGLLEDGPSKLYDAIAAILGLDEITRAKAEVSVKVKEAKATAKALKDTWTGLDSALKKTVDERAGAVLAVTSVKGWTAGQLKQVVSDQVNDSNEATEAGWLRSVASIQNLASDPLVLALTSWQKAFDDHQALAGTDAARASETADLLDQAIRLHDRSHTTDCPVCGTNDMLTEQWRIDSIEKVRALREQSSTVRSAGAALESAERLVRGSVVSCPSVFRKPGRLSMVEACERLVSDWQAIEDQVRTAPIAALVGTPMVDSIRALNEQIEALRTAAEAELAAVNVDWSPLAAALLTWCTRSEQFDPAVEKDLKAAEQWLIDSEAELRAERFTPIRSAVEQVWRDLRCDSNVDLSTIDLEGKGTRRRVAVGLTVDGTDAPTIGVLSQGEIHSLALSMFLPRASLPESPFRFMVIDDPVQAMDPSKVDGLVRQLAKAAETRQVIVLTHDDRLAEAIRRLDVHARVFELVRKPKSVVHVQSSMEPIDRFLKAASSLATDVNLPGDLKRQVVALQCRQAIESLLTDIVKAKLLRRGRPLEEVLQTLGETKTLNNMLEKAFSSGPVDSLDDAKFAMGRERMALIAEIQSNSHGRPTSISNPGSTPDDVIKGTREIVRHIRTVVPSGMPR